MRDVIYEMSSKGLGMTCVVDATTTRCSASSPTATCGGTWSAAASILDLTRRRRHDARARSSIAPATLAAEALNIMEQRKITSIVVVEDGRRRASPASLHLHDLWRTEMF